MGACLPTAAMLADSAACLALGMVAGFGLAMAGSVLGGTICNLWRTFDRFSG